MNESGLAMLIGCIAPFALSIVLFGVDLLRVAYGRKPLFFT